MRRARRSIRLKGYDYSRSGAYFVTICTQDRACLFGDVMDGKMMLNEYGRIVRDEWIKSAQMRDEIDSDEFVVMPNHVHGIIVITGGDAANGGGTADGRGTARRAPTMERFGKPVVGSLPTIIRAFKSAATKCINELRRTPGTRLWQRNYYERIVRNDNELRRIREYITNNPVQWAFDHENPAAGSNADHALP